jgi:tetratricopeptide (TPR) repeat protein
VPAAATAVPAPEPARGAGVAPSAEEDGSAALARGIRLYETGRQREAVKVLEGVTRDHPLVASGWVYLGMALFDRNDRAGASRAVKKALELDPKNGRALVLLATLHLDAGQTAQAKVHLRRYLELYPNGSHVEEAKASLETTERKIAVLPKDETPPMPRTKPAIATVEPAETAEPEAVEAEPAPVKKVVNQKKKKVVKQAIAPAKQTKQRSKKVAVASKQKKVQKPRRRAPVVAVDIHSGPVAELPFFGLRQRDKGRVGRRSQADSIVGPGAIAKQGGF